MKKVFVIFSILLSVSMISCRRIDNKNKGTIGMPNPIKACTAEDLEKAGFAFIVPSESQEVSYSIISDSIAQMSFNWKGCDCNARMQSEKELKDISGYWYTWETEYDSKVSGCDAKVKYATKEDGNIAAVCLWFDSNNGYLYSFSMTVPGIGPGDISDVGTLVLNLAEQTYSAK
ncbi:MAG: hypothetical protein IIT58_06160 [Treponema sp.]|nr:hypothetical protein [Treponema sp.]